MSLLTLVNGVEAQCVPADDRGLAYGDGVFETIAVSRGKPLLSEPHLDRMMHGCARLAWRRLPQREELQRDIERVAHDVTRGVIKVIVTRGTSGRGYRIGDGTPTRIVSLWPWSDATDRHRTDGIIARFCAQRLASAPALAGLKHLNRLEQVLARAEWDDEAQEGLMLDGNGFVVEGTMSNLFAVRDRALSTPPVDQCGVAGIMRAEVMAVARASGFAVDERRLTPDDLPGMDELFVTNSAIGVWSIRELGATSYRPGPVARTILDQLMQRNSIAYL